MDTSNLSVPYGERNDRCYLFARIDADAQAKTQTSGLPEPYGGADWGHPNISNRRKASELERPIDYFEPRNAGIPVN